MEKDIVKKFFLSSVISDDQRKELWIKKIGNRIKINKTLYSNLIERLQHEGVPQKIDKLIRDDLDRTLPSDSQTIKGSHVYEHIKNILKIWHLYRPDIGYTQGMAYYVCLLYTYYDEYMTFKQFSNLVVGNELIFSFYNFDKIKVSFFTNFKLQLYRLIFEWALKRYDSELYKYLQHTDIGLETFIFNWQFTLYARSFDIEIVR